MLHFMYFLVSGQVTDVGGLVFAFVAFIRLVLCVTISDVSKKSIVVVAGIIAKVALERFFSSVDSNVPCQVAFVAKSFATKVALVVFFALMYFFMSVFG